MESGFSVCYSDHEDAKQAFHQICEQVGEAAPKLLVFFSDTAHFAYYTEELHKKYPDAEMIGSTAYDMLSSKGHSGAALSVLAVSEGIECTGGIIMDAPRYPGKHTGVIRECVKRLTSTENCCCFEITTAYGYCEEIVQDTFRGVLEEMNIPVFGGTAGNAGETARSYVSYNGRVYAEACAFMFIRNECGRIRLFSENLFRPTEQFFSVTDVNCEERTVYEFDGKPAARVIAKALGVSTKELPQLLPSHPLGRLVNGNIYVTGHNEVLPSGALTYYSRIYNHTMMVLLTPGDPFTAQLDTFKRIHDEVKQFRFVLVINCFLRSCMLEQQGVYNEYIEKLQGGLGQYIGFSGNGEQMNFEHLNQTMLVAVFE
ncbi:MAG: FIST N-terminal domain-containing protein [bacterium]|nr:FIST N-terminal domain-containing protein [bacterium]